MSDARNFVELRGAGRRRPLRRHRADAELLDDALPGRGVGAGIGEVGLVERERRAGRQRVALCCGSPRSTCVTIAW